MVSLVHILAKIKEIRNAFRILGGKFLVRPRRDHNTEMNFMERDF
jgi:hypothetical protein